MVIKLNNHEEKYLEAKKEYAATIRNAKSTPHQIEEAFLNMQEELDKSLKDQIQSGFDALGGNPLNNKVTANERKFFNSVTKSDGFESGQVLPEETIEKVFEDLTSEHPLLSLIKFEVHKTLDVRLIKSETGGVAVWGSVFGEIKGQLNAEFIEEKMTQNKLTAFIILPKDLSIFGPVWVEAYVRAQITETLSVELEKAIINGVGPVKHEPIGLIRDTEKPFDQTNGYIKKEPNGVLTFGSPQSIIAELTAVRKYLSIKQNGRKVKTKGLVYLIVTPDLACDIEGKATIQNAAGEYITNLPFDIKILESEFAPENEVVVCVPSRYSAYVAGGTQVDKFTQTLALEDCNLYTAKTFMTGAPQDNKVAAIYSVDLSEGV